MEFKYCYLFEYLIINSAFHLFFLLPLTNDFIFQIPANFLFT